MSAISILAGEKRIVDSSESEHLDLERFLRQKGVWFRIVQKSSTVHTADASKVTGISLGRITKSLVFMADGQPILAVVPGDRKVDSRKLGKVVGAQKVELVPFEEAEKFSGYPPGGTSPVYHVNIDRVVFDSLLMHFETIYGGGGARDRLLEMKVRDVLSLSNATVAEISRS